ncbi:protein free1 [Quercus suber]|uniref:Protein free1 n=1 Tax=Quercus suber TaxID=58331 RepID=A0AAW0J0X8_QUESU
MKQVKFQQFLYLENGDSIVDIGNNNHINTLIKCNFPPYGKDFQGGKPTGRFSNGRILKQSSAEELGLKELLPAYLDSNLQLQDLLIGAEVTQRLSYGRETSEGNAKMHSHEDLAKKLQEEMGRNHKTSGLEPAGPGMQMSEVACPICTVHLKVLSTGSETVQCSVCQHPFPVSAH